MKKPPERSLLKSFVIVAATAAAIVMTTVSIALIATATDVTTDTGKTAVTHEDITGIADIGNVRTPDAGTDAVPSAYIATVCMSIKNLSVRGGISISRRILRLPGSTSSSTATRPLRQTIRIRDGGFTR